MGQILKNCSMMKLLMRRNMPYYMVTIMTPLVIQKSFFLPENQSNNKVG